MKGTATAANWWDGEDAVRLSCVPRHVPKTVHDRYVTTRAVRLWTTRGIGGVRLRRFRFGGQWCTTRQELARWQAALTARVPA